MNFENPLYFLPSSRSERAVIPRPPRVKCIVLLFFLCPYATFKILFIIIGGIMSFSHRPTGYGYGVVCGGVVGVHYQKSGKFIISSWSLNDFVVKYL